MLLGLHEDGWRERSGGIRTPFEPSFRDGFNGARLARIGQFVGDPPWKVNSAFHGFSPPMVAPTMGGGPKYVELGWEEVVASSHHAWATVDAPQEASCNSNFHEFSRFSDLAPRWSPQSWLHLLPCFEQAWEPMFTISNRENRLANGRERACSLAHLAVPE